MEFEHHRPKIHKLSDKCVAMTAGDALAYCELFSQHKKLLKGQAKTAVSEIIEGIKEAYRAKRNNRIIDETLKLRGFDSIDDFYAGGNQRLPSDIFYIIDREIVQYDFGLSLIVSGIDEDGAHIYAVENPGTHRCHDSIGYYIIGSGVQHAQASFISQEYTSSFSLNKAVYCVYEAKIFAESAPGVGEECDISIITDKGITKVTEKELQQLEEIYKEITPIDEEKVKKLYSSLPFEKEKK